MIKPGFLLHIITEVPASIAFFFKPSMTLSQRQPHAQPVIQQYALLLLASTYIAYVFLYKAKDDSSRKVAAALAFYHVGPLIRACCRIRSGGGRTVGIMSVLRNPWVHLLAHLFCFVTLLWET